MADFPGSIRVGVWFQVDSDLHPELKGLSFSLTSGQSLQLGCARLVDSENTSLAVLERAANWGLFVEGALTFGADFVLSAPKLRREAMPPIFGGLLRSC